MNNYINLNRIEFVITGSCSGKCKHCSNSEQLNDNTYVNAEAAVTAIKQVTERFKIDSVMTFGGEPLLYSDVVCEIHAAARDCGIPKRQLITNGFFTKVPQKIDETAKLLYKSGVTDVLLSVDVFHQEFIPIEPVMQFAEALISYEYSSFRVHPAWVVNEQHDNKYNAETKLLLKLFTDKGISVSEGNNIFPSGNALKHLSEYFAPPEKLDLSVPCGSLPYTSRLDEIDCIGINPNGDVNLCSIMIGNIYNENIMSIIDNYDPYGNPAWKAVLDGGATELLLYAQSQGVSVDISDCRSACGVCRKIMKELTRLNIK